MARNVEAETYFGQRQHLYCILLIFLQFATMSGRLLWVCSRHVFRPAALGVVDTLMSYLDERSVYLYHHHNHSSSSSRGDIQTEDDI